MTVHFLMKWTVMQMASKDMMAFKKSSVISLHASDIFMASGNIYTCRAEEHLEVCFFQPFAFHVLR